MKRLLHILLLSCAILWLAPLFGQEEESAAVSLESYTDAFQENFFEALKQKGIENYDKAIHSLLVCKELEQTNSVVDHELAKAYLGDKQYLQAQEYSILTLLADPENIWYLDTLVEIVQSQGGSMELIKDRIPYENSQLKENLALVYYRKGAYIKAMEILDGLKQTAFTKILSTKISDSLNLQPKNEEKPLISADPLQIYKNEILLLLDKKAFSELEEKSEEALELFPSQPYFYYVRGLALNQNGHYKLAIEVLEAGLDYLLDEVDLNNNFYKELAAAYKVLGNTSKANMYLSKIKSGS